MYGKNLEESKTWLACIQPKAGTTNWQKALLKSSGNTSDKIDFKGPASKHRQKFFNLLDKLSGLSEDKRKSVLKKSENQVNFLHVRNPFDRLYSAWHQKFNKSFLNVAPYERYVDQMEVDRTNSEHKIPDGMLCSFADFVKYSAFTNLGPNTQFGHFEVFGVKFSAQKLIFQNCPVGSPFELVLLGNFENRFLAKNFTQKTSKFRSRTKICERTVLFKTPRIEFSLEKCFLAVPAV